MYVSKNFIKAISQSYQKYIEFGARSTEKLKPIHNFVAQTLQNIWGNDFSLHYIGENSKEMTIEGKYYPKDVDITVTKNDKPIMCLGVKFVTSNYKQNANNYFENMMGETANIQARKDLPYFLTPSELEIFLTSSKLKNFQLIVLRYQTPYYAKITQKTGTKEPSKIEIINEHDLQKYINLAYDTPQAHKPYSMGILLIDIDETTNKVKPLQPSSLFEKDFAKLLENKLSVENLFTEIENYKKFVNYSIEELKN